MMEYRIRWFCLRCGAKLEIWDGGNEAGFAQLVGSGSGGLWCDGWRCQDRDNGSPTWACLR